MCTAHRENALSSLHMCCEDVLKMCKLDLARSPLRYLGRYVKWDLNS